eukprot:1271904-Pyramimonas_sp.AAC.1
MLFDAGKKRNLIAYIDPSAFADRGATAATTTLRSRAMMPVGVKLDLTGANIKFPKSMNC